MPGNLNSNRLQPDRWQLHPEDFRVRMDWEYERQRILNLQAESIEKKLPYPKDKIPPIPQLKHPTWHLRHLIKPVTAKPLSTHPVTDYVTDIPCVVCGKRFTPARADARYCSGACRTKAHRTKEK